MFLLPPFSKCSRASIVHCTTAPSCTLCSVCGPYFCPNALLPPPLPPHSCSSCKGRGEGGRRLMLLEISLFILGAKIGLSLLSSVNMGLVRSYLYCRYNSASLRFLFDLGNKLFNNISDPSRMFFFYLLCILWF